MNAATTITELDPVRANTIPAVLQKIDATIDEQIRFYATQPKEVISRRIAQLEKEWDIDRVLETKTASIALASLVMGLTIHKKWLVLSAAMLSFQLLHAVQGWSPSVPALRRFGIRTRGEIDREKFALKVLRGDFQDVSTDPATMKNQPSRKIIEAVKQ